VFRRIKLGGKLVRQRHDACYVLKKMLTGMALRKVLAGCCGKWRQTLFFKEYF
jgi:hypothetical protein